ncbi:Na+/H+ antiporter subunit E [Rhodovulum sp. 12E13]|uniref:Na+/H+ antiporter subunit E n=1 Tax=Rhodovulum sp. 12E13 TaxID=2203891 RepID=UPI000E138869|nr:Na+/H+ antiporter subunit E [Rhodovulum sp. 12E13]RDC71139.1 Na+/H+ antiporter subunit E [Rhodovulum sp. 12E13]
MLRRIFPHPQLTLMLTGVWLLLVNTVSAGNLLLGLVFGLAIPVITQPFWQKRPVIKRPLRVVEYIALVTWDIVMANVVVAYTILFKSNARTRSAWVRVPLDLTSPEAITLLAGTITMTPGTVASVLSADASSILVHCLDTDDPEAVRDEIKHRYERRLKEIFE